MPRVNSAKKSSRGKDIRCEACGKSITAGQEYYFWEFRYGGKHNQHKACGMPKASQLTQSKLSAAYSAIESAEKQLNDFTVNDADGKFDLDTAKSAPADIANILNECASEIESVRDEYQESLDNMPDGTQDGAVGSEIQEKIENLESFVSDLQDAANDIENEEFESEDTEPEEPKREDFEDQGEHGDDQFADCMADYEAELAEYNEKIPKAMQEWVNELVSKAQEALSNYSF